MVRELRFCLIVYAPSLPSVLLLIYEGFHDQGNSDVLTTFYPLIPIMTLGSVGLIIKKHSLHRTG